LILLPLKQNQPIATFGSFDMVSGAILWSCLYGDKLGFL